MKALTEGDVNAKLESHIKLPSILQGQLSGTMEQGTQHVDETPSHPSTFTAEVILFSRYLIGEKIVGLNNMSGEN